MTRIDLGDAQETPLDVVDGQRPTTIVTREELTIQDASTSASKQPDSVEPWATMVIRPGDTLFDLSEWFGVQPGILAAVNGVSLESLIIVGQTLVVPVPQSVFVLPPEPAQDVSQAVGAVEEVGPASGVELLAETGPAPVIVAPPGETGGYEGDVVAVICALPWPCEQMVAIATCESGLNPSVFNSAGYYGLFQINYAFEGWDDSAINAQVAYEQKYLPAMASGDPLSPWPVCRWY
ncbi:MAG: LysM peptidoglycan-binding domain-containing protein [Acidimicrobiia bacterium]